MKTQEGNKLIAEFMDHDYMKLNYLCYHDSWDWLMPVVKKIRKMSRNNEMLDDISINTYIGWYKMWRSDLSIFSDKETIYKFCVDFIKEYNHTKKPDNPLDHTPTIEESPFLYKRKEIHV